MSFYHKALSTLPFGNMNNFNTTSITQPKVSASMDDHLIKFLTNEITSIFNSKKSDKIYLQISDTVQRKFAD